MQQQKKSLGGLLASKRGELNLSLKEIEAATSIRMNYLQAIEEGQIGKLISPVHAQGFIRQYASFLGLDGEKLIKEYCNGFQMPALKQEFAYGIGTMEVRGTQGGGVKSLPGMLWVGVLALVLVAAWFFAKFLDVL